MCIEDIKESNRKLKYAYKVFVAKDDRTLLTSYARQEMKINKRIWQGATISRQKSCKMWSIDYSKLHIGKVSVFLTLKDAKDIIAIEGFSRAGVLRTEVWKVELKYDKLLVGKFGFDWDSALVDKIRLVRRC
jgi:hypothetical protein